jgi:hypothetical protein
MRGVSNPFLALPTNRAAKPGVHRSGNGSLVTRIPGRGWAHHTCTIQANQANQAKEGTTP